MAGGGGGAGAGIGGNGGKGGNGSTTQTANILDHTSDNPATNTNCGWDGENGEDCGNVNIYNSLAVYAYGGAGASGGNGVASSGGGAGGYPAAGIGGGGAGGGGGNHCDGAGGFSGGGAEGNSDLGYNGIGGGKDDTLEFGVPGGGYFYRGKSVQSVQKGTGAIGGQGGCSWGQSDREFWYSDRGGSGGNAGNGGTVRVSSQSQIYAYNGDMITNGDYSTVQYEYDKDGTKINQVLNVITKQNGEKFIPCKIFAQTGLCRVTYTTNQGQFSFAKVTRPLAAGEILPVVANSYASLVSVKATDEKNIEKTNYTNGYMPNQGIGSGAGYLEISNGTYIVDESMN